MFIAVFMQGPLDLWTQAYVVQHWFSVNHEPARHKVQWWGTPISIGRKSNLGWVTMVVNTLRLRQDGRRFPDDTLKRIFLNENVIILIKISLKFVPYGPINNIPALVQIMAWCRSGDKPLSEPMTGRLPTHICVTRPQWVNLSCAEARIFWEN